MSVVAHHNMVTYCLISGVPPLKYCNFI